MDKVKSPRTNSKLGPKSRSERSDFSIKKAAMLTVSDGTLFKGQTFSDLSEPIMGEVVFNTGMSGYVESLTDPSYSNEILVFTYPLIGNYGVQLGDMESKKIQVKAVIMSTLAENDSHADSVSSLRTWLEGQNIPALFDVDTRALTKHLRVNGTMLGAIDLRPFDTKRLKQGPVFISVDKPILYNKKYKKKVILVDCGAKENILRSLLKLPVQVKRVPLDYDYSKETFDGVVISNGPGDPTDYRSTIAITKKVLSGNKPVFGICLGNQIMALAVGAKTFKLTYGHRGHNQPCIELASDHCYITSQNHGYAVDEKFLPKGWSVSFRNLNDNSVEGIAHKSKPFFAVQFHPEASPGPTDTGWLFERFNQAL